MARLMALCSLPRTNPGNRFQYKRVNGPFKLVMYSSGETKLPYGNLPRLILAWVCTEAVRTGSRELVLGKSLSDFMRSLGVYSSDGKAYIRLRNQMDRLFSATVQLIYEDELGKATVNSLIADSTAFWWNPKRPAESTLWESKIHLSEPFFNEIVNHPVPLDMNTLAALKRCALALISTCGSPTACSRSALRCASPGSTSTASLVCTPPRPTTRTPSKTSAVKLCAS